MPLISAFCGKFRLMRGVLRLFVLRDLLVVGLRGVLDLRLPELVPPRVVLLRAAALRWLFLPEELVEVVFLFAIAQMFLWHYNMEKDMRQVVW